MRLSLLAAVLASALAAQNSRMMTVKTDNYPLRAGCSETEMEVARLRQGDPVKIRFALSGTDGRSCYSVNVEVDGTPVNGYVSADALTGLEEFEQARRKASQAGVLREVGRVNAGAPTRQPAAPPGRAAAPAAAGPVPDFSVAALDEPGRTYSPSNMRGKLYLIDFWATWCVPCLAEMPTLHRVYEKYKYRNFEILSISLDRSPEDVAKFRRGKWNMPWLNAFDKGMWDSEVARRFGIRAIPSSFLVDASGNIVGRGGALRGSSLEGSIERALRP